MRLLRYVKSPALGQEIQRLPNLWYTQNYITDPSNLCVAQALQNNSHVHHRPIRSRADPARVRMETTSKAPDQEEHHTYCTRLLTFSFKL